MQPIEINNIPHSQRARLEYIERQLMWGRAFKARMLMQRFSISRQQVGSDFALYMQLCPDNIQPYDPTIKAYTPKLGFTPKLITAVDDSDVEDSLMHSVQIIKRADDKKTLPVVLSAIQKSKTIEFVYGSASFPIGIKRVVIPTRILSTSNQLYFRAYCTVNNNYQDFTISRCLTIPKLMPETVAFPADQLWDESVEVTLKVNPHLDEYSQKLVLNEYGSALNQEIILPIPTLRYFLIDNNLPLSGNDHEAAKKTPWAFPIFAIYNAEADRLLFGEAKL